MSAGIRIFDSNNGVDVRVGLLNDLGQVLDGQLGVVPVDLLHADGHAGRVHAARTIGVDQAAVTRLNPQPVAGLLTAPTRPTFDSPAGNSSRYYISLKHNKTIRRRWKNSSNSNNNRYLIKKQCCESGSGRIRNKSFRIHNNAKKNRRFQSFPSGTVGTGT